ncbi:MAG: ribosome small subunit-dependent GTPase A [Bacteroidetes bacterium]|nr:ribosome small subunit-dependent GTPase A [Bacteroidota bacterium]
MEKQFGVVIKSTGSWYSVLADDKNTYACRIKGKFRLDNFKSTNPIAVGDRIRFHFDSKLNYSVIDQIEERRNFLVRKSTNLSKQSHIIASNLDYAIIIASLKTPRISTAFIDRFLVIIQAYEITPIIVFNKIDLLNDSEKAYLDELVELYDYLGFKCFTTCAIKGTHIQELKSFLKGKTSLFTGQSGVGKSTILNCIDPELGLKISSISTSTKKGKHSTTFYEMHQLDEDTFIVDSPGIRELGLFDFEAFEVGLFFPEFKSLATSCKYPNCLHMHEPECAIIHAVEEGLILEERYINYLKILEDFNL